MASYLDKVKEIKRLHPEYAHIAPLDLIRRLLPHHPEWRFDDLNLDPPPELTFFERIFPTSGMENYTKRLKVWADAQMTKFNFPLELAVKQEHLKNDYMVTATANNTGLDRGVFVDKQKAEVLISSSLELERGKVEIQTDAAAKLARVQLDSDLEKIREQARLDDEREHKKEQHDINLRKHHAERFVTASSVIQDKLLSDMTRISKEIAAVRVEILELENSKRTADQIKREELESHLRLLRAQYAERDGRLGSSESNKDKD